VTSIGFWYRLAVVLLRQPMTVLTKRDWAGAEHLPESGGFVVAANHVSHVDPIVLAHFLYDHGRPPRYLAKASLFTMPMIGRVIRGAGQIPVHRESADAAGAFRGAVEAVERGECVAIYPEGTITRDPGTWPMTGKTGAARVALATGCPVIPIAQWGPQEILPAYTKVPKFLPRKTMHVVAGPPVDLSGLHDGPATTERLRTATELIMSDITGLLEGIRGETAPAERFDLRTQRAKQAEHAEHQDETPGAPPGESA
jgi:1-acyl-sn-glycerol-3-phosphate acyltransferase